MKIKNTIIVLIICICIFFIIKNLLGLKGFDPQELVRRNDDIHERIATMLQGSGIQNLIICDTLQSEGYFGLHEKSFKKSGIKTSKLIFDEKGEFDFSDLMRQISGLSCKNIYMIGTLEFNDQEDLDELGQFFNDNGKLFVRKYSRIIGHNDKLATILGEQMKKGRFLTIGPNKTNDLFYLKNIAYEEYNNKAFIYYDKKNAQKFIKYLKSLSPHNNL